MPGINLSTRRLTFRPLDISRGPVELLPFDSKQPSGRHNGYERGWQPNVSSELEGVQGSRDRREREPKGREAVVIKPRSSSMT
jgi:hypothetical protein